jgi:hypothetical protein
VREASAGGRWERRRKRKRRRRISVSLWTKGTGNVVIVDGTMARWWEWPGIAGRGDGLGSDADAKGSQKGKGDTARKREREKEREREERLPWQPVSVTRVQAPPGCSRLEEKSAGNGSLSIVPTHLHSIVLCCFVFFFPREP